MEGCLKNPIQLHLISEAAASQRSDDQKAPEKERKGERQKADSTAK